MREEEQSETALLKKNRLSSLVTSIRHIFLVCCSSVFSSWLPDVISFADQPELPFLSPPAFLGTGTLGCRLAVAL